MNESFGAFFILNGELRPAEEFDSSLIYEGESVYEVLRIIDGLPVFFYDHISRLESSARYQKKTSLADKVTLRKDIARLLSSEEKGDINLKVVFNYNKGKSNRLIYFLESVYPSPEQYNNGVYGILYHAERKDPESKVINHKLRSEIYHRLIMENAYEALLVNRQNCITEGSRSNIFFIKEDNLFSAPDNEILNGITRMHIIEICRENGIKVNYGCLKADRLMEYESSFMSGTSPVILPFNRIGEIEFNVNHRYSRILRDLYKEKAEESMRRFAGENPLS